MTRVNAALLAGAMTVLLLASVTFGAVGLGGSLLRVVQTPLFLLGAVGSFVFFFLLPVALWWQRRARRAEPDERPTPLPSSERLKDRRGL
jgi:membrane protein implicated in regulation of membrane protease activity